MSDATPPLASAPTATPAPVPGTAPITREALIERLKQAVLAKNTALVNFHQWTGAEGILRATIGNLTADELQENSAGTPEGTGGG